MRRAVVGHVLADALLPAAAQPDLRRRPDELARDGLLQLLELMALDEERQVGDSIEGGHNGEYVDPSPPRRGAPDRRRGLRRRRAERGPLLAPAGIVSDADAARFERETDCRVDLRVYDPDEDLEPIAERRDTDAIAAPTENGETPDVTDAMARLTLKDGVVVTVPDRLAAALDPVETQPAGRGETWTIREEGDNDDCARRWIAYATSQ